LHKKFCPYIAKKAAFSGIGVDLYPKVWYNDIVIRGDLITET
jgi:hypothetical protein